MSGVPGILSAAGIGPHPGLPRCPAPGRLHRPTQRPSGLQDHARPAPLPAVGLAGLCGASNRNFSFSDGSDEHQSHSGQGSRASPGGCPPALRRLQPHRADSDGFAPAWPERALSQWVVQVTTCGVSFVACRGHAALPCHLQPSQPTCCPLSQCWASLHRPIAALGSRPRSASPLHLTPWAWINTPRSAVTGLAPGRAPGRPREDPDPTVEPCGGGASLALPGAPQRPRITGLPCPGVEFQPVRQSGAPLVVGRRSQGLLGRPSCPHCPGLHARRTPEPAQTALSTEARACPLLLGSPATSDL